jgi:molybdopterin-guanine dinucleotide biosynthesis protein B
VDVAVIKHTHHDVDWDQPGKDSWRHREAGAPRCCWPVRGAACWCKPCRKAMMRPGEHVAALRPCDLVLAEGFKHEAIPKLEVYDPALGHAPLFTMMRLSWPW